MTAPAIEPVEALRRRQFLRLSGGTLAALAAGCTPRAVQRPRESTLIIAYPGPEQDMNPVQDEFPRLLVFLPLIGENANQETEGRLAERWEHSPDYREWTFHLRPGVRWHDGVPVTAHDVKFSLELVAAPTVDGIGADDIESITLIDNLTVRVRYRGIYAERRIDGWEVVYPKHLLERLDPARIQEWDFWTHPVGNGPYRFVRFVQHSLMELRANPDYYRGKPRIERVVIKFLRGQGAGVTDLLKGDVDILMGVKPSQGGLGASIRRYYSLFEKPYAILWNNTHPLFHDRHIRQALTLAIDRRELCQVLNLPDSLPIVDGPFTWHQVQRGDLPAPLPHDPQQARALFEAAGWQQREPGGVRVRDGQAFQFTMLCSAYPGFSQIATYVQAALKRVGLSMAIQPLDGGLIGRRISAGQFDAVPTLTAWSPQYWEGEFGEHSPLGYHNSTVIGLLKRLPLALDPDEQSRIRRQITEIFRVDVPATFLFPRADIMLAHRRVRGLSSPWRANPLAVIADLSLDNRSPT